MTQPTDSNLDGIDPEQLARVRAAVATEREAEATRPLMSCIMGATGVGKSSLYNALFGTNLATGDIGPVTLEPQLVRVPDTDNELLFWDLPGFGESAVADRGYLGLYQEKLLAADVVLWAVHADNRAVTYDLMCLERLLDGVPADQRAGLFNKITFVLSKVDLLHPPPWIYDLTGDRGVFVPGNRLAARLAEKERYVERVFLAPRAELLTATTYNDGDFTVTDANLSVDEYAVRYRGYFSAAVYEQYLARFPAHAATFGRLRDNHRVHSSSSRFRFNLLPVLIVLVNRLGFGAVTRFQKVLGSPERLTFVPADVMRTFGNLVIWDGTRDRKLFDLQDFPLARSLKGGRP
jgi:hypothetical protein